VTDDIPETPAALLDRARQHAADVATEHFPELPVEAINWEISHRQRQAGVTKYNPTTEAITIVLTWTAYEQHGWEQFSGTVRHELIHVWQYHEFGDADHGTTFARWTPSILRNTANALLHQSGGLCARIAAVGLLGIDSRRPSATRGSTAVASAMGHSASRRTTITDRKRLIVFWELP
jgi:predicted SprT family Zn-dependent metalloprotease